MCKCVCVLCVRYLPACPPPHQWCKDCYGHLGDPIQVGDATLDRAGLTRRRLTPDACGKEDWVQCSQPACGKWQHQACALFNRYRHGDDAARTDGRPYLCPHCVLEQLTQAARAGVVIPRPRLLRAAELKQVRCAPCPFS